MDPKLCRSGLALVVYLFAGSLLGGIAGCNSDTTQSDEKTDPVLVEFPVVYIEREIIAITDDDTSEPVSFSARDPLMFNPGAQLLLKKNAFEDSIAENITAELFGLSETGNALRFDIRDITVADDGQSFLVSIRAPEIENADEDEQPTWNIWYYQLSTKTLKRVIVSDVTASQGDDLMASFLPDGRIIFASTRQRLSRAILLDEGKPQYTATTERSRVSALNLHVMQADGTNINQLTFNLSHDYYPLVLQNGKILYSRWDTMGGNNLINLYQMNPDGTENELIYGWHSHQQTFINGVEEQNATVDFIKPQQLPNGDILLLLTSKVGTSYQKRPVVININDFIDHQQNIDSSSAQAPAQQDLFLPEIFSFSFFEDISKSGRLSQLFPLPDSSGRFLLSWDLCRVLVDNIIKACGQLSDEALNQENVSMASPWYELWLYNEKENTQQRVATTTEGKMLTEAIIMQPSANPSEFIADKTLGNGLDASLANEQAAAIHIRSVYDFDGIDVSKLYENDPGINRLKDPTLTPAKNLPARFLRIVRGVPMPPRDVKNVKGTDFGRSRNQLMREIIGYTPIQPDGSVKVKIPANVPVALSVLDANGQRIGGRHRQWITLKAGEILECNGCHTRNSEMPHGRLSAQAEAINKGAELGGDPFPNTNPAIIPQIDQTMAQADEMTNGLAELSADILYRDIWTDPNLSVVNPEINYTYRDLESKKPNGSECFNDWTAYCRIQINYVEHIQPLWLLNREVFDPDTAELVANNTCTVCHNTVDDFGVTQVPAGQLDLTDNTSTDEPDHLTGYRELMFNDVEQEVIEGLLVDKFIILLDDEGNIVYVVDPVTGNFILDDEGNKIPVMVTVNVPAILSTNSAQSSRRFFNLFNEPRHQGMLSDHEKKLVSEWLDIGGQYYNTPFYSKD